MTNASNVIKNFCSFIKHLILKNYILLIHCIMYFSHAIMAYLVNKYAPDNKIYPKDPQKRAVVDRMFYFDIGNLAKAMFEYVVSIMSNTFFQILCQCYN